MNFQETESKKSFSAINKIKTIKSPTPNTDEEDDIIEAILEMFGTLSV